MDIFEKALSQIGKEYTVRKLTTTYAQIDFLDELFDAYNCMFIGVLFEDNQVILTDNADYAEICRWEEKDLVDVKAICDKHHIIFKNWHIECVYQNNQDIKNYLDCLRELSEKYVD